MNTAAALPPAVPTANVASLATPSRISWGCRILTTMLLWQVFGAAFAVAQTPITVGYQDFFFGSIGNSQPTAEKPESKLWWNDGSWWGSLYNTTTGDFHIFSFDLPTQSWVATPTRLDDRPGTKADTLWDGTNNKLYVVSHITATQGTPTTNSSQWGRLYRYTYSPPSLSYSLDAGFPVTVTRGISETLTIAKDSSGTLWVTYVENSKVMVNHSLADDLHWATPYQIPNNSSQSSVNADDISAVVAFDGKVGVLWSNHPLGSEYFSVHLDGASATDWSVAELVYGGYTDAADDHINIKVDGLGRLYVALKTSLKSDQDPLILLAVRDAGTWTSYVVGKKTDNLTRPIVLLDEQNAKIYVFAAASENGGAIYLKTTDMNNISFAPGRGTPFIEGNSSLVINNSSSTKQSVNSTTGILVIASEKVVQRYYHNFLPIVGPAEPTIDSLSPTSGAPGSQVVISGTNLDNPTSVKFHTTDATTFTANSSTQITATVPTGATTGKVTVTTQAGSATSAQTFTVTGITPTITSFTPTSGIAGTLVAIYGAGFTGTSAVEFNGAAVTGFTIVSDNEIDTTVPALGTTGPISVTNSAGTAFSSGNFTVFITPTITSFTPASGVAGTEVTIQGTGFTGVTSAQFNNVAASTFTVDSDIQLRATVPLTATTGPIQATNMAGTGISPTNFTILAPVALPPFAPIEDSYIQSSKPDTNFGNSSSILAREGGGTTVTYKSYLKFSVSGLTGTPTSAVLRLFVTDGGAASQVSTTDNSWTETGITWNNAPAPGTLLGSTTSTVTGTWIEISLPPETFSAGNTTYSFIVTTNKPDTINYSSRQGAHPPQLALTQASDAVPTITSFTPTSGPVGTVVVITGTNFENVTAVKFGATAATVYSVDSATQISAAVPIGASTGTISVTTSVGTGTSAQAFTLIIAPTIASFTPTSGIAGNLVAIHGSGFTGTSAVAFNGAAATGFTIVSDNEIDATVPGSVTTGPISVTNSVDTASSSGNFTVFITPTITSFTPASGVAGTEVTIQGTGFTGVTSAQFNNVAASTFTVDSDIQLRATVPLNATTGKIQLTNIAGTAISETDFTVTPSATLTFTPIADSYTQSTQPTKNLGSSAHLFARLGTETTVTYNTYLRFSVGGLAGVPTSAVLRLFVNDGGSSTIVSAGDNSWTESGITWANAPAPGTFYGSSTPTVTGTWVSVPLPTSIFAAGNTDYSFVITSDRSDSIDYSSRQGLYPPQLVLTQ